MKKILEVKNLNKTFFVKKLFQRKYEVHALSSINLDVTSNETLGIVGESGCGKSTLARVLTKLENPSTGELRLLEKKYDDYSSHEFHSLIQMVFQDPYQSLNPRKKAYDIIADPLRINFKMTEDEIKKRVMDMMNKVGLREELQFRYPHQFSGGQRQRLGIARALMLKPRILILDEPVSALDVSIQAQVLNLLMELQKDFSLSYLFISHDLSVVQHVSDRILVMYLGRIVEYGNREDVFLNPQHPYTKILLASAPKMQSDKKHKNNIANNNELCEIPSPLDITAGCPYFKRCSLRSEICAKNIPLLEKKNNRLLACFNL